MATTNTKKTATTKKAANAPKPVTLKAPCAAPCEEARGVQEIKEKVVDTLKKVPAWFTRVQKELAQLVERLQKLQEFLDKLSKLIASKQATKDDKENFRLLSRQKRAMEAYKAALDARVAKFEKDNACAK